MSLQGATSGHQNSVSLPRTIARPSESINGTCRLDYLRTAKPHDICCSTGTASASFASGKAAALPTAWQKSFETLRRQALKLIRLPEGTDGHTHSPNRRCVHDTGPRHKTHSPSLALQDSLLSTRVNFGLNKSFFLAVTAPSPKTSLLTRSKLCKQCSRIDYNLKQHG